MFSGPTEHAANPPETWTVRKAGDKLWQLVTKDGTVIDTYPRKGDAQRAGTQGQWVTTYRQEGRWYAGHTPHGWTPWEQVKAAQARTVERILIPQRDRLKARLENDPTDARRAELERVESLIRDYAA